MDMVTVLPKVGEFLRREHAHFIDGAPSRLESADRLKVLDPSTGAEVATVANGAVARQELALPCLSVRWGFLLPAVVN